MPVITDIQQQKRTPSRYSIYLDKKYLFSLSDLELSNSNLRVGQLLSDSEAESWIRHSVEEKAYHAALRYLGYRPRSRREMADYLGHKEFESEVTQVIIERLEEHSWIDDIAFAASWIASRQALRPRSARALEAELLQKGVDRDVIAVALSNLGVEAQEEMLMELIIKRRRQTRYQDTDKLMQYLARQGFSYPQIKKALMRLDD